MPTYTYRAFAARNEPRKAHPQPGEFWVTTDYEVVYTPPTPETNLLDKIGSEGWDIVIFAEVPKAQQFVLLFRKPGSF